MYSYILRNTVVPLFDFVTGNHTRRYLRELEKSQWLGPAALKELQESKLRHLIKHAYETVPHYHRLFQDLDLKPDNVKSIHDLTKLPVLHRAQVREEFDSLISRDYPRKKMVYGSSGGSTGEPIRFCTTRENRCWSMASRYLAWRWAGFEVGDKFAYVFGSPLDKPFFESFKGRLEGKIKRRVSLDAFQVSERALGKFVYEIRKSKPKIIYGYAVSIAHLARFIEDKGIDGIHPKSIIIDSMGLSENEVKMIERIFGCRVWWNYHNRENGTFASECSERNGYHLFAQNFVFEFLRKGEVVVPGEKGSLAVTDLTNYAMPFIRYEVGDLGIPSDEICTCGRGLPLMKKLLGRTSEILVSKNGEFILDPFHSRLEHIFETRKIKQYQVVQEDLSKVTVNIVPDRDYSQKDTDLIEKAILSLMGDIEIEVKLVDEIPPSSSGKVQIVLRKFPLEFT